MLHVLEALEGGTARHLVDIVRHASPFQHHVVIPTERVGWATDHDAAKAVVEAGALVHVVQMRRSPASPRNLAALGRVRRLVTALRPSVVHGHSSIGGVLARASTWTAPVARLYTPNGIAVGRGAVLMERMLGRRTTRLIAVSPSEGDLVLELGLVPRERLAIVPNGIDLKPPETEFDLRRQVGIAPETPLVGSVARLVHQKSPVDFVRVCARVAAQLPLVHFVHIGTGPLERALSAELGRSGLGSRYHLLPFVGGAGAALAQLDVFVLASKFEGAPYTPLEAMRGGTPVVLSDVVGNRDLVEHGRSGVLVPHGDIGGFADAVVSLLTDRDRRDALTIGGRARLNAYYDVRLMGERISAIYVEAAEFTNRNLQ